MQRPTQGTPGWEPGAPRTIRGPLRRSAEQPRAVPFLPERPPREQVPTEAHRERTPLHAQLHHSRLDPDGVVQASPSPKILLSVLVPTVRRAVNYRSAGPRPTDALFSVTSRGSGSVNVPGSLRGVTEVMVTSEPLGGSSSPTGPPLLLIPLHA